MIEKELVEKAQNGNRWALEQLLKENYNIVYGFILKLSMSEDVTNDITQETMVKAITNIRKFKGDSKFSTWLISIASNSYKDSLKKNRAIPTEIELLDIISSQNTENDVILKDQIEKLVMSLLELPESQRKAFVLKHYYDFSYEEIAIILGCPIGTVRSKLHYCILKLKNMLDGGA